MNGNRTSQIRNCTCGQYMFYQNNSDNTNPDDADIEDGLLIAGLGVVAFVFVIASVVGFVCGLRSVGWL